MAIFPRFLRYPASRPPQHSSRSSLGVCLATLLSLTIACPWAAGDKRSKEAGGAGGGVVTAPVTPSGPAECLSAGKLLPPVEAQSELNDRENGDTLWLEASLTLPSDSACVVRWLMDRNHLVQLAENVDSVRFESVDAQNYHARYYYTFGPWHVKAMVHRHEMPEAGRLEFFQEQWERSMAGPPAIDTSWGGYQVRQARHCSGVRDTAPHTGTSDTARRAATGPTRGAGTTVEYDQVLVTEEGSLTLFQKMALRRGATHFMERFTELMARDCPAP